MEKTPRKSPRLNKSVGIVDSPPISSRPSGRSNDFIVINSSSSYKVQKKDDYGADTKSKGKEKLVEDHYPYDSDFEDDIPLSKRLRVNHDQYSKNVDGGSVSKGMNGLSQKWTRFVNNKRKKASQVPLKYTFEDLVFMDEELHIIESENLTVLTDMPFNKKSKRDRYVRQNQNLQTHSVVRQNVKDLPHSSAQKVGSDPSLSFNKDLQKIAQEVVKVRNELEKLEKNVNAKFVEMKAFMDSSFKYIIQELKSLHNDVSTNKDLGGERNIKVVVEDQRKGNVDVQNEHLQDCGDKDGVQTPSSFRNHVFDNNCKFFFVSLNILQFKKWVDSKLSKKRGKKDIDWNTDVHYAGRPVGDPLVYGNRENIPQQCDNSTDCGLYTCVFAEYVCHGDRNVIYVGFKC
uniref:Ulp1 protease family, C-terminal catalytic domain containing protein n=1 Tax=Solanum tuberosum TaxID=4113 RepID=M1AIU8_SOLTU